MMQMVKINKKWIFGLQEDGENLLRMSRGVKNSLGGIKIERQSKVHERQRIEESEKEQLWEKQIRIKIN